MPVAVSCPASARSKVASLVMKSLADEPVSVRLAKLSVPAAGSRIVDLHLDRIAGRTVAGRIRHHRAEHIVAVRQVAQVRRGGRKRPAVAASLVGHRRAGRRLLARQRQIEGCILGDEVARGRARIGQVGKAQRPGRRQPYDPACSRAGCPPWYCSP